MNSGTQELRPRHCRLQGNGPATRVFSLAFLSHFPKGYIKYTSIELIAAKLMTALPRNSSVTRTV